MAAASQVGPQTCQTLSAAPRGATESSRCWPCLQNSYFSIQTAILRMDPLQTSWCQKPQDAIKRSFCPWAHRSQLFRWHDLQNFKQLVLLLWLIRSAKYNYEAGIMCVFRGVTVLQMHRFDGSLGKGNEYVIVCLLAGKSLQFSRWHCKMLCDGRCQ